MSERDRVAQGVGIFAALVSLIAFLVTDKLGAVLLYKDAISHMEIARRVIDSSSSSHAAQLGGVWLPLPHILMLPFVWSTTLYYDGIAGTIGSMVAYVVAAVLLYKIVHRLTGSKFAGIAGAAVFMLNANMLYMQSTPMTEALLFATLLGMIYCTQQWADTDDFRYLMAGGAVAFLAILTRYESWPILACLVVAIAIIAWVRKSNGLQSKQHRARVRDRVVFFTMLAGLAIACWMVWDWAILGNPLYFQEGEYAKPSLWEPSGEPALGHLGVAAKAYWYAMTGNETIVLVVLAAMGLVALVVLESRKRALVRTLPVLTLLAMVPFYVLALDRGQRPLHVMQINGDMLNARFGLIMLLPVSILIGYLVGALQKAKPAMYVAGAVTVALAIGLNANLLVGRNVITYNEPKAGQAGVRIVEQREVVAYFRPRYTGGLVLLESFGNEIVDFSVPSQDNIYEGSYRQWLPALHNPSASHIKWIIFYGYKGSPDQVATAFSTAAGKLQLRAYRLVYVTPDRNYLVYEKR